MPATNHDLDPVLSLLEEAPVGVALATADREGRLLEVNETLCEMLGYGAEELRALSLAELGHPDDHALTQRLIGEAMSGTLPRVQLEKRYRRRGGEYMWVLVSALSIRAAKDGRGQMLVHFVDINDRKRAEEQLAASEQRFRNILETSHEGIWEFDADRRLGYVNPRLAEMLG